MPKPLARELRIQNVRTKTKHCHWCDDEGLLVVAVRDDVWEEYGPCPYCEAGDDREKRHWGPVGFWQGRELPELKPLHPPEDEREWLSPEENARRLRELTATLTQKP